MSGELRILNEELVVLTEKLGQVKKLYLDSNKINKVEFEWIKKAQEKLEEDGAKGDYTEWLARTLLFNEVIGKEGKNRDVMIQWYLDIYEFISMYDRIRQQGYKKQLPEKQNLKQIKRWVNSEFNNFYEKRKMKIHGVGKDDYEEVYHKGPIQIFKIKSHDGMRVLGSGTKWCVASCTDGKAHWNAYIRGTDTDSPSRFYVIRDHTKNSKDIFYKIAVQVYEYGEPTFWDAVDADYRSVEVFGGDPVNKFYFKFFDDIAELPPRTIQQLFEPDFGGTMDSWSAEELEIFKKDIGSFMSQQGIKYKDSGRYFIINLEEHQIDGYFSGGPDVFPFYMWKAAMEEVPYYIWDLPNGEESKLLVDDLIELVPLSNENIKIIEQHLDKEVPNWREEQKDIGSALFYLEHQLGSINYDEHPLTKAIEAAYLEMSLRVAKEAAIQAGNNINLTLEDHKPVLKIDKNDVVSLYEYINAQVYEDSAYYQYVNFYVPKDKFRNEGWHALFDNKEFNSLLNKELKKLK
jgi:hypothetical protein